MLAWLMPLISKSRHNWASKLRTMQLTRGIVYESAWVYLCRPEVCQ